MKISLPPLDSQIKCRLKANIYPAAWPAIGDWNTFPWHKGAHGKTDTWKPHSSQALAIDVFGTLCASSAKTPVLNTLAVRLGLPESSDWSLFLEWLDPENHLHEINQHTQVDALAMSGTALMFFECKFTEADGGRCSQPLPIHGGGHKGLVPCSGDYVLQTNPANHKTARCALSAKGIRYWEYIPHVFQIQSEEDYQPCPFSGPWYQWMRNLTNASAVAQATGRKAAFLLVYADAPTLPVAMMVRSDLWKAFTGLVRMDRVPVCAISYQDLQETICQVDPSGSGQALQAWVTRKIQAVVAPENAGGS